MNIRLKHPSKISVSIAFVAWLLIWCTPTRAQLALVWDLDGTLFQRSKKATASAIGQWNAFRFYTKHGNKTESIIEETLFDILDLADQATSTGTIEKRTPAVDDQAALPRSTTGRVLPTLMQKWFDGSQSSAEILKKALATGASYKNFRDDVHKNLMNNIFLWMFQPYRFAACMKPIHKAINLLKECAQARDSSAKPTNKLYILSNMDIGTFSALYENRQNKPVFKYFTPESIFISAFMGDFKPRLSLYRNFLDHNQLKAEDCILIDNQQENIRAAIACGMKGVYVNNGDYKHVRKELAKFGAL